MMFRIKWEIIFFVLLWFTCGNSFGQAVGYICNKGIAGNSSSDLLRRLNRDVIDLNPNLVIVLVGTNDLLNSAKMGSVDDLLTNLEELTDTITRHGIEVVLVSPPPVDSIYLFERHDANKFLLPPDVLLKQGRTAIHQLCNRNNYLFVDSYTFFKSSGIPQHNTDDIIRNLKNSGQKDGVHLTEQGNALLARLIFECVSENYGPLHRLKIVCFGDSLTFGAFMKGEGTSTGDTYPAVLKKLIMQSMKQG